MAPPFRFAPVLAYLGAYRVCRAGLAVLGLLAIALTGEAMAKTFNLSISGEDGARYSGACTLMGPSGNQTIELEGIVPLQRVLDGDGVSCRLRAEGRVVVEIVHDGNRTRSATSGGTIRVSLR